LKAAPPRWLLAAALAAPLSGPEASQEQVLWSKLEASVDRLLAETDAVAGVSLVDLAGGRTLHRNADLVFASASVIKLAVLAELYRQEQQGRARLADPYLVDARDLVPGSDVMGGLTPGASRLTNRDLATLMVAVSDNSAANVLIDRLGFDRVNALLEGVGLKHTRLRRKMMDLEAAREGRENTATPREIATLLEALQRGRVVDPRLTEDLFRLLRTPKDDYIPRLLPAAVPVANKPGELEGIRHDAGIVAAARPFVLVVMTSHARDERGAEELIARVAATAFDCLDRIGRATPHGRLLTPASPP
jgi:beta-lactamase class A